MSAVMSSDLERFIAVGLAEVNDLAELQTRRDRKYLVDHDGLRGVLDALDASTWVLDIDDRRWASYESTYLDTPDLVAYHLAARRRPDRFKVRTRRYANSDVTVGEVKAKDRRGRTVKQRRSLRPAQDAVVAMRDVARGCPVSAPYAASLRPTLTTRYERAALVLPDERARVTIDRDFIAVNPRGAGVGLGAYYVVETKTAGRPCTVDRLLWWGGIRPVRFSKYATAMAVLRPYLPSNRWHRVCGRLRPVMPMTGGER